MTSTSFFGDAVGFEVEDAPVVPFEVAYSAALTVAERAGTDVVGVLDMLGLTERLAKEQI